MPATTATKADLPTLLLPDAASWSAWLTSNSSTSRGVWLTMARQRNPLKKPTSISPSTSTSTSPPPTTLTLPQALDLALCHGWINGQARSTDDAGTMMQRFTPRAKRSPWSRINVGHVERLAREGRMREGGWREVRRAKGDGRWEGAYGAFSTIQPPEELVAAIDGNPKAKAAWEGLTKTDRYMIIMKLANVRTPAGRERNIRRAVERLADGEVGSSRARSRGKAKEAAVVEDDPRPGPSPLRESRAERAERRARR